MAKKKKKTNKKSLLGGLLLSKPYDDEEATFTDNRSRRKVFVHLVPAPWSRVIVVSLIYAIAVTIFTQIIIAVFGKPQWHAADIQTLLELTSKK